MNISQPELTLLKEAFKLKTFTVPQIYSKLVGKIKRPTVYFLLDSLIIKGLVELEGRDYTIITPRGYKAFVERTKKDLLSVLK